MTLSRFLACSALVLGLGLSFIPAAQAMDNPDGMSKMSGDAMMHKDGMKKHKKHKDGMMSGDAMKSDGVKSDGMMKKDGAAPAQ